MKALDLVGERYSRLVVVKMEKSRKGSMAMCACDCGATSCVLTYNLRNGNTKSCGCLAREVASARGRLTAPLMGELNTTHGHTRGHRNSPTYASWSDAKKRCHSPQNHRFADYGGRGIQMCARWRDSFDNFLADMGHRPPRMTLDRVRVNGNYEPGNCRWATHDEQAQNQRTNVATPEIVRAIRERRQHGVSAESLAVQYGMSRSNVDMIAGRRSWKNV